MIIDFWLYTTDANGDPKAADAVPSVSLASNVSSISVVSAGTGAYSVRATLMDTAIAASALFSWQVDTIDYFQQVVFSGGMVDSNVIQVNGSSFTLITEPIEADLTANAITNVAEAASTETAASFTSLAATRVVIPVNAIPLDTNRVASSKLILNKRASFTYTLSNVGDLTGVTSILFTIKNNKELDADSASLVQVKLSIPAASGTDGIQYLGAAAAGAKRTSGSIAVQTYTEGSVSKKRIVVAIADDATALIPVENDGTFDIKTITAGDSEILDEGKAVVREVTTWETSS